jgi:DNA-binding NarL/FixJ family response regulator
MHPIRRAENPRDGETETHGGNILLVGPCFKFCRSLVRSIESELEGFGVVYAEVIGKILDREPDAWESVQLIVIDQTLANELIQHREALRAAFRNVIIAMSYDEAEFFPEHMMEYLRDGVITSAVPMNLQLDRWLSAIRLMLSGEDYVPVNLMKMLGLAGPLPVRPALKQADDGMDKLAPIMLDRLDDITPREADVMKLVAEGHQNKEIAARLKLSEHTVKLHIHHIFSKLGAHNRTQAVRMLFG